MNLGKHDIGVSKHETGLQTFEHHGVYGVLEEKKLS